MRGRTSSRTTRLPRASTAASTCASRSAFTIDPDTAQDFDDAIAVRREGDGYRVWVHIADVSHFVPAGSPLDRGAAERAFSLYVPGRVAPMLPPELSNDLCSLRPREDRLCVTVEVPFDANLELGEPAFYRSVIRSRARLTYGQAERILAGKRAPSRRSPRGSGWPRRSRSSCAAAASPAARSASRLGGRVRLRRRTAASSGPGSSPSRTRTCSSRS